MEEYNKIYPELPKEAPKDGKTFRLQQSCRVLENLEKEAKHYGCQEKVQKMLQLLVKNQHINRNSFVLSQWFWSRNSFFWGWSSSRRITWWPWPYLWSCKRYYRRIRKKVSRKVTKHEKTVSVCESKINSLKDRISKALADDMLSDEEFNNILAEMAKYHEMKKDIRHKFQKNKVKKTADSTEARRITPTDSCRNAQKN